ncbi:MAG: ATP-binding protein [Proteobacteria bacterium]|nr:ATP-binding protein [Pseudomonadota bacterium]
MWIKRSIEDILEAISLETPCILVTGMRQTGKTSLLEHFRPDAKFISLDLPRNAEEAENSGEQLLDRLGEPLIIDEVQYAPKLFRILKSTIDRERHRKGRFFLTGSQRFELMREVSDSLAGRVTIIDLPSLSAAEIERFHGQEIDTNGLLDLMWRGGFPELYSNKRNPERFFSSYIASYIERDVRQLISVRHEREFDRFLRLCALRAGQLTSLNPIAAELGISASTAKSWFDTLIATHIINLVEPFHTNLSKRLIKTPKFYFTDTGLQCALAGIRSKEELQSSALLGPIFEAHCHGQILRSFQNRAIRPRIAFFRDHFGHEVDFVVEYGNNTHLIECKWSESPEWNSKNFDTAREMIGKGRDITLSVACSGYISRKTAQGLTIRNSIHWDWLHRDEVEKI